MLRQQQVRRALLRELTPHFADYYERQAIIQTAYAGEDVLAQVNYTGNASVFAAHLLEVLVRYGGGRGLLPLLEAVRERVGEDGAARITRLMRAVMQVNWKVSPPMPAVSTHEDTPTPSYRKALDKYEVVSHRFDAMPSHPPQSPSLFTRIRRFFQKPHES